MRTWLAAAALAAGCGTGPGPADEDDTDPTETLDTDPPGWTLVAEELPAALLSITGTSASDVWAVGADDGQGPTVLHYDGSAWARQATGSTGDLWWGWLPPAGSARTIWIAGDGGRVLRLSGSTWEEQVVDPDITLFGLWGATEDSVWTVGGNVATGSGARMYHWDGAAWSRVDLPAELASQPALFKVWGANANDVWACGANGVLLHGDGATWTMLEPTTERTLLTVAGEGADAVWAVGGIGNAEILRWDGAAWSNEAPDFARELNGVYARDGVVVAVGRAGEVWWRDGSPTWTKDTRGHSTYLDLHAAWLDPDGGVWTVGGSIATLPLTRGVLAYGGDADVPAYAAP
ncbi:MAG TPA: hypothetical protein PKA64_05105 [Myxococcota bacterium]|nr:hypothetical protein [Myxococcota bacterium]